MNKPNIQDKNILQQGYLDVGDGHQIYWVDWGNPDVSEPIFFLHGGPAGSFDETRFKYYDPKVHRVVFHDQRGAGRSLPYGELKNNTSEKLVEDIEKLKNHLGVEKIRLNANSWGTTLSLLYAIAYPKNVKKMFLSGLFLARREEIEMVEGGEVSKMFYPDQWEIYEKPFLASGAENILDYYREKILHNNNDTDRNKHAALCTNLETVMCAMDMPLLDSESLSEEDEKSAVLQTHYLLQGCFLPENYILDNVDKIKHIPLLLMQGRYDMVCPPKIAYDLKQVYGENCRLKFVTGGHSNAETCKSAIWSEMMYWLASK